MKKNQYRSDPGRFRLVIVTHDGTVFRQTFYMWPKVYRAYADKTGEASSNRYVAIFDVTDMDPTYHTVREEWLRG